VPYREWKVVGLYRWQERLTLVQFLMLTGVAYLLIYGALLAAAWWLLPHSWPPQPVGMLPVLAVLIALTMASYGAWERRQTRHRQASKIS
jgi:membrane protein implicated in regulation of membrane protease activity